MYQQNFEPRTDRFGRELREEPSSFRSHRRPSYDYQGRDRYQPYGRNQGPLPPPPAREFGLDDFLKNTRELYECNQPLHFAEFLSAIGTDINPQVAAEKYDEYKRNFDNKKVQVFFEMHKDHEWFKEKYDTVLAKELEREGEMVFQKNYELFMRDWEAGLFANLNLSKQRPSAEQQQTSENASVQQEDGDVKMEEEASSENQQEPKDEEMEIVDAVDELLGIDTGLRTPNAMTDADDLRKPANAIIILALAANLSREQLKTSLKDIEEIQAIYYGEPNAMKRCQRVGWLILRDDCDRDQVLQKLQEQKSSIKLNDNEDFKLHYKACESDKRVKYAPEIYGTEERMQKDLQRAILVIDKLNKRYELPHPDFLNAPRNSPEEVRQLLDWCLVYLRRVFYFCYYSGGLFDSKTASAENFLRKSSLHYYRWTPDHELTADELRKFQQSEARLDKAISAFLEGELTDDEMNRLGVSGIEGETSLWLKAHIERVDDAKFKCQMPDCTKMFKGAEYVEKHIKNKHTEAFQQAEFEINMKVNYVRDRERMTFPVNYKPKLHTDNRPSYNPHHRQQHNAGYPPSDRRERRGAPRYNPYGRPQGPGRGGRQLKSYNDLDAPPTGSFQLDLNYE